MRNYTHKNKSTSSNSATPLEFHRTYHHDELLKIINDELSAEEFAIKHALTCWAWSRNGFIPSDESVIKKFLIRMFGFSNNTKSYKRVLEMYWILEKDGFTTHLIKEAILKTGVYSASTTPSTTPSTCSELPQKHPSSNQVGFSNPLILLEQDQTSKLVSKELTQLETNLLKENQTQSRPQEGGASNEKDDMKKITSLDLSTGIATYEDGTSSISGHASAKQVAATIAKQKEKQDQIIKEMELQADQAEIDACNAIEAKLIADFERRQEKERSEKEAARNAKMIELAGMEIKLYQILADKGANEAAVEKFFAQCGEYAKKEINGLEAVYTHLIANDLYPKAQWLIDKVAQAVKDAQSFSGVVDIESID